MPAVLNTLRAAVSSADPAVATRSDELTLTHVLSGTWRGVAEESQLCDAYLTTAHACMNAPLNGISTAMHRLDVPASVAPISRATVYSHDHGSAGHGHCRCRPDCGEGSGMPADVFQDVSVSVAMVKKGSSLPLLHHCLTTLASDGASRRCCGACS